MFGTIQSGLTRLYAKNRGGVTDTGEYTTGGVLKLMRQLQSDFAAYGLAVGLGLLAMGFTTQSILCICER